MISLLVYYLETSIWPIINLSIEFDRLNSFKTQKKYKSRNKKFELSRKDQTSQENEEEWMRKVLKIISSEFYVFINWCVAEMRANELHPQADSKHGGGNRGYTCRKGRIFSDTYVDFWNARSLYPYLAGDRALGLAVIDLKSFKNHKVNYSCYAYQSKGCSQRKRLTIKYREQNENLQASHRRWIPPLLERFFMINLSYSLITSVIHPCHYYTLIIDLSVTHRIYSFKLLKWSL